MISIRILLGTKFRLEKSILKGKSKNAIFSINFMEMLMPKSIKFMRLLLIYFAQTYKIFERKNRL